MKPISLVAITATASKQVEDTVTKSLEMIDYLYVGSCSNIENIRYSVNKLKTDDTESNVSWLIDELKVNGSRAEKMYCVL